MPTVEDFQDGALARANALLASIDPLTCTEAELLMHGALLKTRDYLRSTSLRDEPALLLSMLTADFENWISRAKNRAALVSALCVPNVAATILGDAPTLAKIFANESAIAAIADNATATNALADLVPHAILAAPTVFAQLADTTFFISRFAADTDLHKAAFANNTIATIVASKNALLLSVFADPSALANFMADVTVLSKAAVSEVVYGRLNTAVVNAMWANSIAYSNWLATQAMSEQLATKGYLTTALSVTANRDNLYKYPIAVRAGFMHSTTFLTTMAGTAAIYQAFWQHAQATNTINSVEVAAKVLSNNTMFTNGLMQYLINNSYALSKNASINSVLGNSATLALAVFKSNATGADYFYNESASYSNVAFYNAIAANGEVLAALLKDDFGMNRLNAESLLKRVATVKATVSDNPNLFARVINNVTVSGVYGSSTYYFGKFTVNSSGVGSASVGSAQPSYTDAHPCLVFVDGIGATATTGTNNITGYGLGGKSCLYTKSGNTYSSNSTSFSFTPMDNLYTSDARQAIAIGGFYFYATSATSTTTAAATATVWRAK